MTPEFVQSFARDCVDAGADLFVGIGPHVLRRIEVYDDSPLFYSLGNFVVQNETVERLPLRSFERYDLDERTHVSAVFDARLYDDGEPKGDLASTAFWGRSCRNVRSRGMAASSGWNSTRVPFNETLPATAWDPGPCDRRNGNLDPRRRRGPLGAVRNRVPDGGRIRNRRVAVSHRLPLVPEGT